MSLPKVTQLGGHVTSLISRLRVATQSAGAPRRTSTLSSVGYQRYTEGDHSLPHDANSTAVPLNTEHIDTTAIDSAESSGPSSPASASQPGSKVTSRVSTAPVSPEKEKIFSQDWEEGNEPQTKNVDTITEWQAGWNVTNAIQVRHMGWGKGDDKPDT